MYGLAGLRPSTGTGRMAWPLSRIVVLFALLGGLFLMHGLSIQDCHGPAPAPGSAQSSPSAHADLSAPMPMVMPTSMSLAGRAPAGVSADQPAMGVGASCVSTPPSRPSVALSAVLLVCGVLVAGVAWSVGAPVRDRRRRAPPRPGRALLTALGVSRT